MLFAGIDIGSTAAKAVILSEDKSKILARLLMPSGWNSRNTADEILSQILSMGYRREDMRIIATGYGRVSVPYADSTLTEITCHGKGAAFLGGDDLTVIDIGGQDTKVIVLVKGRVIDFVMNDKCSAGTGKFLEVMANRMGVTLQEFFAMAETGKDVKISSMCTVFAESEIVSLMGLGTPREDIACGIAYIHRNRGITLDDGHIEIDVRIVVRHDELPLGFCPNSHILPFFLLE